MPEGDTVFLTARRLHEALAGKTLARAELRHPELSTVDLVGREVTAVRSIGKHLFVDFDSGHSLHNHLRLDGAWYLYRPGARWRQPGHLVRVVFAVADRVALGVRLHDLRLIATAEQARLVGHLGPDLLDPAWSAEHAARAVERLAAQPDRDLGLALLDQTAMAGIGNLYKNELCFLLRVSPWTPVHDVDLAEVVTLARKLLLRNALRPEQSTTGELRRGAQHWVYERRGQPCRRCHSRIESAQHGVGVDRRISYFCPRCQPRTP